MKSFNFDKKVTSAELKENLSKLFNANVNLDKYDREQLEDIRNQLRTKVFQYENQAGFNELLTDETYQKDKAILQLLNTRINEMLGEDFKKLKDKLDQLDEAKKSTKSKGDGNLANNYPPYDKVTRGDVVAGALGKDQKGGKVKEEAKAKCTCKKDKKHCPVHGKVEERFVKGKSYGASDNNNNRNGDDHNDDDNDDGTSSSTQAPNFDTSALTQAMGGQAPKQSIKGRTVHGYAGKKADKKSTEESAPSAGLSKKQKSAVVKKAKAGGDIGKPGKGFAKVEKAAKAGGAKDPKAVAAAAMWKNVKRESQEAFRKNVRLVNESLEQLLQEDEEAKAKIITAAGDMVNDFTSWMQRVGQFQTKSMIELADAIKSDFGPAESEAFKQAVAPALATTLETLTQQREAVSNAVATLAGEATVPTPMGPEPEEGEAPMPSAEPDQMNKPSADQLAASEPAATGREMRESRFAQRLAESHSIISKLAK